MPIVIYCRTFCYILSLMLHMQLPVVRIPACSPPPQQPGARLGRFSCSVPLSAAAYHSGSAEPLTRRQRLPSSSAALSCPAPPAASRYRRCRPSPAPAACSTRSAPAYCWGKPPAQRCPCAGGTGSRLDPKTPPRHADGHGPAERRHTIGCASDPAGNAAYALDNTLKGAMRSLPRLGTAERMHQKQGSLDVYVTGMYEKVSQTVSHPVPSCKVVPPCIVSASFIVHRWHSSRHSLSNAVKHMLQCRRRPPAPSHAPAAP